MGLRGILCACLLVGSAFALPRPFHNESEFCLGGARGENPCGNRQAKYERLIPSQPGYQWDDAGGYCGSWASQRAVLAKGAWISQQQFRDHTSDCGGHDEEILSCNIEEAWTNLKLDFEGFDFKNTPLPQTDAYLSWLKKQLVQGYPVAWMIMWSGQSYPIYGLKPPAGMYGHVEPVIGIQSSHPLTDATVYDDDYVLHYTDAGTNTVTRRIKSLPCSWKGEGHAAFCGFYSYGIGNPYGFGWAMKGFVDNNNASAVEASLKVNPWKEEPDTRSGEKPNQLQGTLTVNTITGATYSIYRWDSVDNAFTYSDDKVSHTFTATDETYTYVDPKSFPSDGTTYYRALRTD